MAWAAWLRGNEDASAAADELAITDFKNMRAGASTKQKEERLVFNIGWHIGAPFDALGDDPLCRPATGSILHQLSKEPHQGSASDSEPCHTEYVPGREQRPM